MVFNANEVFELAEQIERNGKDFYTQAAASVSQGPARDLFSRLADLESMHEKHFSKMRQKFTEEVPDDVPDFDTQYDKYLSSLAEDKIFNRENLPVVTKNDTPQEILECAIGLERLTVMYFASLKDLVPESLGKDKIDFIIKEELKHIDTLNKFLETLEK